LAIAGFSKAREDASCIVAGHLPAIHQAQPLIRRSSQGPPPRRHAGRAQAA